MQVSQIATLIRLRQHQDNWVSSISRKSLSHQLTAIHQDYLRLVPQAPLPSERTTVAGFADCHSNTTPRQLGQFHFLEMIL